MDKEIRMRMVNSILVMKAKYEKLYWSSPNVEYEKLLSQLANMTDEELQCEVIRLHKHYRTM